MTKRLKDIDSLPNSLVTEILARLPVKDIYTCRAVCKNWKSFLSSREFLQLHKRIRPSGTLSLFSTSAPITNDFYLMEFARSVTNDIEATDIRFRTPFEHSINSMIVSNTCNGFFCYYNHQDFYICNPIINEYVPVPQPSREDYKLRRVILGFEPTTEKYKLLRFLIRETPRKIVVEVLVLNASPTEGDIRRRIDDEDAASSFDNNIFTLQGPVWNGAFHQVNSSETKETGYNFDSIVCFDFVSNRFKTLPAPSYFDEIDYSSKGQKRKRVIRTSDMAIGVLEDLLCVGAFIREEAVFQVWAMKEYGIKESWTRLFAIRTNKPCWPITLFRDGTRLLIGEDNIIVSCVKDKTRSSTFIKHENIVIVNDNLTILVGAPYSLSFTSLKDVAEPYYKNVKMGQRLKTLEEEP